MKGLTAHHKAEATTGKIRTTQRTLQRRFQQLGPFGGLFVLHQAPPRFRSAVIAGLCTAAPIAFAQAMHQPALGLIASIGALAALYAGRGTAQQEATAVGTAALGLILSFAIGSTLAGHPWAAVLGNALWAVTVTAGCALAQARPPGAVMLVLLCAVGSGLPPAHPLHRVTAVAAVAVSAAVLSWLVAAWKQPAGAEAGTATQTSAQARWRHFQGVIARFPSSPMPWMAARAGIAVALAGSGALICHVGRPYWAMAAAGAVLARGSYAATANARALLRGTGTAAGCVLAGALAATHPQGTALALLLAALTALTELVVARNYALAMIFVTPLSAILVASAAPGSSPLTVTADRLLETLLGCLAAVAVGQLVTSRWAVRQRRRAVADVLLAAADVIDEPSRPERTAALRNVRSQLLLVGERTAGERRTVRAAAATLDQIADAAQRVAHPYLENIAGQHQRVNSDAMELRRIATLLLASTRPHVPGHRRQDPSPDLADLTARLDAWNRRAPRQPANAP